MLERLSAAEWVQPGALPDGVHVLGADGEPDGAVLTADLAAVPSKQTADNIGWSEEPWLLNRECYAANRQNRSNHLESDLAKALKMSQAVSGEIVRDRLIEKLLVMAVEHAGAGRN